MAYKLVLPGPPPGIPPADAFLAVETQHAIRGIVSHIRRTATSVRGEDVLGMAIISVATRLEKIRIERRRKADVAKFVECHGLAVLSVTSVEYELARHAGVLPRIYCSADTTQQRLLAWRDRWFQEYEEIQERGHRALPGHLTECREREIFEFAAWNADRRIQSIDTVLSIARGAKRRAFKRKRRARPDESELDPMTLLADIRILCSDPDRLAKILCVDEHGCLALGPRQLRDAIARDVRPSPTRDQKERVDESEDIPTQVAEAEQIDLLRRWQAERRQHTKAGSVAAIVAEHMHFLGSKELSQAELARQEGLAESTVSEAYKGELARLRRFMRATGTD